MNCIRFFENLVLILKLSKLLCFTYLLVVSMIVYLLNEETSTGLNKN